MAKACIRCGTVEDGARRKGFCNSCAAKVLDEAAGRGDVLTVPHADIDFDRSPQLRVAGLNPAKVEEYAELRKAGIAFRDRPVIFKTADGLLVGDGLHRLAADADAGSDSSECEVREGTPRDCLTYALSANSAHGLHRSYHDKRNALTLALNDPEWGKLNNYQIADLCGVTEGFVRKVKKERQGSDSMRTIRTDDDANDAKLPENQGESETVTSEPCASNKPEPVPQDDPNEVPDEPEGAPETPDDDASPAEPDAPTAPAATAATQTTPGENGTAAPAKKAPKDPADEDDTVRDPAGNEIPPQATEAFALRKDMNSLCRRLDEVVAEVKTLGSSKVGVHLHYQSIETHLKNARQGLWAARPTHCCPYCLGQKKDCQACKGEGWVTARIYDAAPAAMKGAS